MEAALIKKGVFVALLTSILFFYFSSQNSHRSRAVSSIAVYEKPIPDGAIIFRRGSSIESQAVLSASKNGNWSHVGIVFNGEHGPTVIHATPAEEDGLPNVVKQDSLDYFLAPKRASDAKLMIVRGASNSTGHQAALVAKSMIGKKFGIHPAESTSADETYCTELVIKSWKSAGVILTNTVDHVSIPIFSGYYFFPSSLSKSEILTPY